MAKWLLKSEPSDYSIDNLKEDGVTLWTGIRNFQARNFIRDQMKIGDQVFIYHSSCKNVGIAGVGEVVTQAYPDPDQFNKNSPYYDAKACLQEPKWFVVDIKFCSKTDNILPLKALKAASELKELVLIKQSRLSVSPVSQAQWDYIQSQL